MFFLVICSVTFLLGAVGICLVLMPCSDKPQPEPSAAVGTLTPSPFVLNPAREGLLGITRLIVERSWDTKSAARFGYSSNHINSSHADKDEKSWIRFQEMLGKKVLAAAASGRPDYRFEACLGSESTEDEQQEAESTGAVR